MGKGNRRYSVVTLPPMAAPAVTVTWIARAASTIATSPEKTKKNKKQRMTARATRRDKGAAKTLVACRGQGPPSTAESGKEPATTWLADPKNIQEQPPPAHPRFHRRQNRRCPRIHRHATRTQRLRPAYPAASASYSRNTSEKRSSAGLAVGFGSRSGFRCFAPVVRKRLMKWSWCALTGLPPRRSA